MYVYHHWASSAVVTYSTYCDSGSITILHPLAIGTRIATPEPVPVAASGLAPAAVGTSLAQVYTSYYVVQLADGQEVADDLLARLANDHAAVSSGDTLRMFTCFFVADSTPQLIIALLGLATVAAELESLLGVSTFWAVWCVTVLAGSLADAAFSTVPITAGPAAGVGGAAAALLAHHLHNWRIEQLLAQAKSGHVPEPLMQLEHTYNRQRRLEAASESVDSSNTIDAAGSNSGGGDAQLAEQQQQQRGEALMSDDSLVNAELEGPAGLSVSLMLPREGKAFVTLGGTAVAVLSALKDAADTDVATDWAALVAGFVVGGVLGWLVCPVYAIELRPASSSGADVLGEGAGQQPDLLLPVLHDMRPLAERANALVGAAALLFAALGAWLTTQGMFS